MRSAFCERSTRYAASTQGGTVPAAVKSQAKNLTKDQIKQHKQKHTADYKGKCTSARIVPVCVPESQATTCAPGCGPRINNCTQTITCPCPSGQDCLSNGTCARPCAGNNANCAGCNTVNCGPSTEGTTYCSLVLLPADCASLQVCDGTADCPQGFMCQGCGGGMTNRCGQVGTCSAP